MARCGRWFLVAVAGGLLLVAGAAPAASKQVRMLVYGAANCPHCAEQKPFLDAWARRYPELTIEYHDIWRDRPAMEELLGLSRRLLGTETVATPATVLGQNLWFGFDAALAADIEQAIRRCLAEGCPDPRQPATVAPPAAAPPPSVLDLPLIGEIDPRRLSLPLLTVVLGLLDSVNPCAFFVLLFLLSLMVHAHSRRTMLLVGGTFVLCSGLVYFLFMAAWLNLFLLLGELPAVTFGAGVLAVLLATLNIKDFFWFRQGVSLSIPEEAKPGLFRRMRTLTRSSRLPAVLAGTVVLAGVANSYELLCTAGFPMVFTRVLTLEDLPGWEYYTFLALYNLVYVLPLLGIVIFFVATFGSRKLSEWQGRVLKLLSGLLMLVLGLVLLSDPTLLQNPVISMLALGGAVLATVLIAWIWRRRMAGPSP